MVSGTDPDQDLFARFIAADPSRAQFVLSPGGVIRSWGSGAAGLTLWPTEEAIGRAVAILYPDAGTADSAARHDLETAARLGQRTDEAWRVRRDGTEFIGETRILALHSGAGELLGFGVSIADITGRKAAETALARSELHLRSILATVPDAMIVIDARGHILSFSAAAERLFDWTEAQMLGRNVNILMPDHDAAHHDGYVRHYCDTGERRIIGIGRIVVGKRRDGSAFPMELSVGESNSDGHRIFTGFIRDLTSQQRAELQLRELQSELIHVSRVSAMGTMASTLAHELNQPLTAIANYMEGARDLLDAGESDTAMLREAIDESAREALRAGTIVRRLREFVARGKIERQRTMLPGLIDEASRLALLGARQRGVRPFFDLDPAAQTVLADRVQLQQVLVNLIRNAVEALDECPVRDITITAAPIEGGMIRISVTDTGPGIAPAIRPRLFDAFNTSKAGGMGLGLSICRTIVEAHGGRISASERAGGGTIVSFTVPNGECEP